MKPLPVTEHCLFSFAAFMLSIDPKWDECIPELLTSSLILPYVPAMNCLIFFCFVLYVYKSNFCFHMFPPGLQKDSNDASDDVTESFSYPVVTELIEDRFWGSKDWFKLKSILVNRLFHIKIIILIYVKIKRCVLTMGKQLQLDNIPEGYIRKLHSSTWPTVVTMCRE